MDAKTANRCRCVVLLLALLAVPAAAILAGPADQGNDQGKPKPAGVNVIEQPGFLYPAEQIDIYARITGEVVKVTVDLGDRVKKGDVLAKLSAPDLEKKAQAKRALVEAAQIAVVQAKQTKPVLTAEAARHALAVKEAKAALLAYQADVTRWEAEKLRADRLLAKGVYDKATWDDVMRTLQSAQANEAEAREKLAKAELLNKMTAARLANNDTDIELALAKLEAAQAAAAQANALVQFTDIVAPFDGVVIRRNVGAGALAWPPTHAKATPLFTLARVDSMRLVVQIPEMQAVRVVKGMDATIRFQAIEDKVFKGKIARMAGALDLTSRTMRVEIDLPNPDGRLLSGMYATVAIAPTPR